MLSITWGRKFLTYFVGHRRDQAYSSQNVESWWSIYSSYVTDEAWTRRDILHKTPTHGIVIIHNGKMNVPFLFFSFSCLNLLNYAHDFCVRWMILSFFFPIIFFFSFCIYLLVFVHNEWFYVYFLQMIHWMAKGKNKTE